MKKLKLLLTGTILGLCIFATPVFANEKANETDYKDHFKTATVTIHEQKHNEETYLKVFDEDNRLLFYTEKCEKTMYVSALSGLNVRTAPTIDAVEVVRCKDCKYSKYKQGELRCYIWSISSKTKEDGYCFCGARMVNENENAD